LLKLQILIIMLQIINTELKNKTNNNIHNMRENNNKINNFNFLIT